MSIKSLKFEPIELTTGLTASAFLDALRESRGEIRGGTIEAKAYSVTCGMTIFDGISIRGMSLSRAADIAGRLIEKTRGKAAKKLRDVFAHDTLQAAILATDAASDKLSELQARARLARKATERAINRGYILNDLTVGAHARDAEMQINRELTEAREELRRARRTEDEENIKVVRLLWGDAAVDMTDKDEGAGKDENKGASENASTDKDENASKDGNKGTDENEAPTAGAGEAK